MTYVLSNKKLGSVPTKDMWTPSPQFWCHFHKRCTMCWNEWKINFPIFIFRCRHKNDHNSKNENWKNREIDFSFVSAHSASFIKIWPLLRRVGGGGVCISFLGTGTKFRNGSPSTPLPSKKWNSSYGMILIKYETQH